MRVFMDIGESTVTFPIIGALLTDYTRPGSGAHATYIRREPRWEDFEYTYVRAENRFAYFGNGQTAKEQDPGSDMTPYLKLDQANDLRNLHEFWWDL